MTAAITMKRQTSELFMSGFLLLGKHVRQPRNSRILGVWVSLYPSLPRTVPIADRNNSISTFLATRTVSVLSLTVVIVP